MATGFYWDETCFWLAGGNYAFMLPVGGLVQPLAAGGLAENPETKRRFKNLLDVTGLGKDLVQPPAAPATWEDLSRVHPEAYLKNFQQTAAAGGGEIGHLAAFGPDGFEQASLSAGLAKAAITDVMSGAVTNAYALSRPPGHHCLPDLANGFCLLANIAIALEAARAAHPDLRAVVLDWDVHHGNGTEAIYFDRADTLTISLHQENNYPLDTGAADVRGEGDGLGYNLNIPLPPGSGHAAYLYAMQRIVLPAIHSFAPDIIVVACGFDAAAIDPLSRMLATADTFAVITDQVMQAAQTLCQGRLAMVHEGGYSEVYVPFCGHAVVQTLAQSEITAPDPMAASFSKRQGGPAFQAFVRDQIDAQSSALMKTP